MILRKPYAFLIKHFKLIHFIMALCMGVLLYQTTILQNFLNEFAGSTQVIVDTDIANVLLGGYIYIFPVLVVIMSLIVLVLMSLKDKPRLYYLLNIVTYIGLIVLYIYASSTIGTMQKEIVDERIVRAIRDLLNLGFIVQLYTLFISLIRSIGIDVKKFDFREDAEALNLNVGDSEEFEVNIEFDSQTLKRNIKRQYRDFKYYFVENKYFLLIILAIIVVLFSISIIKNITSTTKKYSVNQVFNVIGYNMAIENAYLIDSDTKLNKVTEDNNSLVVVKFKIRTLNKTEKFVFGKLALQIGNTKYYHNNKYASAVTDLGTSYINQKLTDEFQEFVLIYEVPSSLEKNDMKLVYTEQLVKGMFNNKTDDKIIPIAVTNLKEKKDEERIMLNQEYTFGGGLLNAYELKFSELSLNSDYHISYKVCVSNGTECYDYYEVVQPKLSGNIDKAIFKVSGQLNVPENGNINSPDKLITSFGSLVYKTNGIEKKYQLKDQYNKTHDDGNYYFEINKEILNAEEVNLVLDVRNNKYIIKIK